ncbi:2OG-Fe(II) oxygenase [Chromobacterium amazonense]|uniref:2OG-Fe(II) oxygenase n=1 Tax=Chromobacterium amazonense TaxID=1382803 RepID=A0ABU8V3C3_9NEIS|nr:2OG-Fe(II) oxygenase [Chromobacterium amazonense]MDQ4540672.1 2OG-Fe(II) oxygenase [Chromobacterium amazonense]
MKIHRGKCYVIIDDFLEGDILNSLRKSMDDILYQSFDSVVDAKVDGVALRSRGGFIQEKFIENADKTSTVLHEIFMAVTGQQEIFGKKGQDWQTISFAFWKYGVGSRLGWHNDAGNGRTGEFVFYTHRKWKPSWGGELIILDEPSDVFEDGLKKEEYFAYVEQIVSESLSPLVAIQPRPNRLVMIKSGVCHYINRVDVAADKVERMSLTGFVSQQETKKEIGSKLPRLESILGLCG